MTPLGRLADVVSRINGPVGDEGRVVVLVAVAPLLIDVARIASKSYPNTMHSIGCYNSKGPKCSCGLYALGDALTALDSAIEKELGQ